MFDLPSNAILYADSAHGQYIPQYFAESVNRYTIACWSEWLSDLDALCRGPEKCEFYWDIWDGMLNSLVLHDSSNGQDYSLYQDGDLWLVPVDWNPED